MHFKKGVISSDNQGEKKEGCHQQWQVQKKE
jgi:hypothetical protein